METHLHPLLPPSTSKSTSASSEALTPTDKERHKEIRITNQGKMKSWITAALAFFDDPDPDTERTLVLHTLPSSSLYTNTSSNSTSSVTLTVPRLISVTEIIKREFIKNLENKKSTREVGLFQYNEIGTLEELRPVTAGRGGGDEGIERANRIIHAMGGQNHPIQTRTPYMRITLSTIERPELLPTGASYQPPIVRKFSRSAKARAKKRAKKATKGTQGQAVTADNMEP